MNNKFVFVVVALFVMQGYALNMNVQDVVLDIEQSESTTAGRSTNVMPAISDTMQQYMLDNQDQNGDIDNDGDGIADDVDKDDDNDCIPDIWDGSRKDFDDDGINDADDIDDDGDGFNDSEEVSDTSNMTNIYDADNDGYHDCSSMGMLHLNILDVQVDVLADGSVEFTIDASNLVDGENATVFWNLVDTDDFLQLNNSTTTVVVPSTGDIEEIGTWYGLPDGPYCLNVELSGSDASGNSDVLDSAQECFTIDSTSTGGGGGGTTTNCPPEVLLSSRFSGNQTTFIFGVEDINLYAYHPCLIGGVYEWNFSMTGPNGYMANEWSDGAFFIPQGPTDYDFNVKSYTRYDLSPGTYSWAYGLRNSTQGISEWFTHNFTVVNSSSTDDCDEHPDGLLYDNFDFTETTPTSQFDLLLTAECLMDDGQIYELVFQLWAEGATNHGQDNAGSGQWESYENSKNWSISWFNPVSNVVKEWEGGHYTFKAMLYFGPETNGVIIDEINHDFCVTTASFNCNDSGGGSDDPSDNETEPVGYCSFPSFSATPTELFSGEDLTFTWSMDGDVSDQVYLALLSGWGTQYYFSSIEDNDGSHTITLPANMNPNADYTIYIESAYDDNRTTLCWKYGSIDILNEGEGPVDNDTEPTPTVDETPRISMWYGKVNQHNENGTWMTDPDGVAGAGLYQDWGDEGWGDRKLEYCQRFWPSTVDVVLRDMQEEIVFYTRGNIDGYVSMKPVWECILEEDQVPVLSGSCTIDLTVTPQEIMIGETLTMEWTMTGDIPTEVRVAVASHDSGMWNVGVQYHVSQHIANTGIFEYVIPAGMNPDRDYVVYVDAVLTDDFTTYCWRYGSFDLLADNEGAIEEVIDNLFNTTDRTPRISMWYGKVNQHNENGTWMTDPDGTAGAGNYAQFGDDGWGDRKLEYCQRFWPNTLAVEPMGAEEIVFYTRGNAQAYLTVKPVWQCVHDTDGDGELDNVDVDDDNDGWTDILEQACGTNELDPSDVPADSDGDQICDLLEEAAVEAVENSEGLPTIGVLGTLAVLCVAFVLVSRKELEE